LETSKPLKIKYMGLFFYTLLRPKHVTVRTVTYVSDMDLLLRRFMPGNTDNHKTLFGT